MSLQLPPFTTLEDGVDLDNEKGALTVGQLRSFIEDCPDDAVVWMGQGGRNKPVRPVQHLTGAKKFLLAT
jgi:hypothetical protein